MFARRLLIAILLALSLLASQAQAGTTSCPGLYAQGEAPEIVKESLAVSTREICYKSFVVMHSGLSRTPLWSAEHLTRSSVSSAEGLMRKNNFHPDPNLPPKERAELRDYSHSGYDRGHMAPNGDMPDPQSQYESFSLANMIPQNPNNNRNLWESIESAVRLLAKQQGEVYVVSGPLFLGEKVNSLNRRVLIPSHIFKAVYVPRFNKGAAYLVQNAPGNSYEVVSIAKLLEISGIDVFPQLPASVKNSPFDLPHPQLHRQSNYDQLPFMSGKMYHLIKLLTQ